MSNKDKKIGEFSTLTEARAGMRKLAFPSSSGFKRGSYMSPKPVFQEPDGSYSILTSVKKNAIIIEYVDIQSGRRFLKKKIKGRFYYIPKKPAQNFDKILTR